MLKNLPAHAGDTRDTGSVPGSRRSPSIGNGGLPQYFLPGKPHGRRRLASYSPQSCKELDMID